MQRVRGSSPLSSTRQAAFGRLSCFRSTPEPRLTHVRNRFRLLSGGIRDGCSMSHESRRRILIVEERPEVTAELLAIIQTKAAEGPTQFRVVVPNPAPSE